MKKLLVLSAVLIVVVLLVLASCGSNKNTTEACIHETSLDLDRGNYDAVLSSPCADTMQLGAAWVGKAGFDIKNVVNQLITASTSTSTDLSLYMTALVPATIDSATLNGLDNAKQEYTLIPSTDPSYNDAQFYISIVDTVKSLSLIKNSFPNVLTTGGTLNTSCDANSNGVPDDADATACELIAVANINSTPTGTLTCNGATYSPAAPVAITTLTDVTTSQTVTGTYSGLTVTVSGSGTTSGCTPAGNSAYKRLLYRDANGHWWAASTSTTDQCSDGVTTWPCPLTGANLDLVANINTSINSAVTSLSTALTTTTSTDVQQSINDLQAQACTTSCSTVCPGAMCPSTCTSPYTMNYCSSQAIANYIETNLK